MASAMERIAAARKAARENDRKNVDMRPTSIQSRPGQFIPLPVVQKPSFVPLPAPSGRNETEDLRAEVRQRNQRASGQSAAQISQRETARAEQAERIYQSARSAELRQANAEKLAGQSKREAAVQMGGQSEAAKALLAQADALDRSAADRRARQTRADAGRKDSQRSAALQKYRGGTAQEAEKGLRAEISGPLDFDPDWRRAKQALSAIQAGDYGLQPGLAKLTEEERNIFLSAVGRGDWAGAGRYLSLLERDLNRRDQEAQSAEDERYAYDHPVLGTAARLGSALTRPLAFAANAGQAVQNAVTGDYETTDTNSKWFKGVHGTQDLQAGLEQKAEAAGGPLARQAAALGLNLGDMALQMGVGGLVGKAGSLGLMGASVAGDTTLDSLERGGTPGQALANAAVAGAAEVLTEKLPVDQLFDLAKGTGKTGVRQVVRNLLGTMGSEGAQEAVTEIADNLADQAIMGDKSQYETYVRSLMEGGMDERSARNAAAKQFYLSNVGQAAMGGALLGGIMGGGAQLIGYANRAQGRRESRAIDRAYQAMQADGVFSDQAAQARREANRAIVLPVFRPAAIPFPLFDREGNQVNTDSAAPQAQKPASPVEAGAYRAVKPENVELPTVPIINLSMQTVADMNGGVLPKTGNALRKDAIARARARLGLDQNSAAYIPASNVIRNGEEYVLKITRASLNKMLSPAGGNAVQPESIIILDNIERIANNGVWFDSQGDRKSRTQINGIDHLKTTVYIDGAPHEVDMRVRLVQENANSAQDNVLYYFTPEEVVSIKKVGTAPPTGERRALTGASEGVPTSSAPIIADSSAKGNTQSAPKTDGVSPEDSTGAAPLGFDPYSHLQNQSGSFHPDGENAFRQVDVPTQDYDGRSIPKSAATVMESQAAPDSAVAVIRDAIARGEFSFDTITDQAAGERARKTVAENGFDGARVLFHQAASRGVVSKNDIALGQVLLNNAMNAGDSGAVIDILTDYSALSTASAQAMQAQRMLKKLSPEGQLYAVRRSVENYQAELQKRLGDKAPEITVDKALYQEFLDAGDQSGRDAAMEKILQNVADQVPATWTDKWNAWRYLSMLGNPRTHVRNIVGNAGFVPVRMVKDAIATVLESGVDYLSPKGIVRTKAALNPASQSDRALVRACFGDIANVEEQLLGSGKYSESAAGQIRDRQTIFKAKPLEAIRKANSAAMDVEDTWFSKPAYAGALAGYLKANGITAQALTDGTAKAQVLDDARAYAVREAQKATYRDANALSDFIAGLGYKGDNKVGKAANVLLEGVLPFKRTPANILARGLEYSPAGLAKGLTYDLAKVHEGSMTAADAIDDISAGLTGTGLLALGAWLASMGLVSGGGGDDKEQDGQDDLTGGQSYALSVGGKNYTLDWLAPEALPFFTGVELWNTMDGRGEGAAQFKDFLSAAQRVTDPMLEMSMLQGLQDAITAVKYNDAGQLPAVAANAVVGYLSQGIPTLLGQAERTGESERETTFIDRESGLPNDTQYLLGKTMNKIPGVEFQQMPYIDAWGRTESNGSPAERAFNSFLNPSYVSKENVTAADRELQRLKDAGQDGVFPQRVSQSEKVDGKYLSQAQYEKYARTTGQTSYDMVSSLIDSPAYQAMDDEEKANAVELAYRYARAVGKEAVSDYEPEAWISLARAAKKELGLSAAEYLMLYQEYGGALTNGDKVRKAYQSGLEPEKYLEYASGKNSYNADEMGSLSIREQARSIRESGLTQEDQTTLWVLNNPKWPDAAKRAGVSIDSYIKYKVATAGLSKKAEKLAALRNAGLPASLYEKINR